MNLAQLLTFAIQGTFVLIAVVTAVDWARHLHPTRRDVAIMFGAFGLIVLIQWYGAILGTTPPVLSLLGSLLLVAHPYLLLRVIHHFRPVPRAIEIIGRGGLILSWLALIVFPAPLPSWADFVIVGYFAFLEIYAALAFVRGAANAAGVTHGRLSLGALASGMLALFILAIGAAIAFPAAAAALSILSQFAGLLAGLAYYLAFATPSGLRRLWQLDELGQFVREGAGYASNEPRRFFLERLCRASVRAIGGPGAAVAVPEPDGKQFRIIATTEQLKNWHEKRLETPALLRAWRDHARVVALKSDWGAVETEMADPLGAGAMLVCPVSTPEHIWGVLFVFTRSVPLFVRDDFNLLALFCEQTGIALAYSSSLEEQRRLIEKMGEQAKQLSLSNRELENEILDRRSAQSSLSAALSALRRSEEELRALFSAMTDHIFTLDRNGRYLSVAPTNPGPKTPSPEVVGKSLNDTFPQDQAGVISNYLQLVLDTQQTIKVEYETEVDGVTSWFAATIAPLRSDLALWVARDITERKQAEESLRHYSQRLEALNEIDRAILAARSLEEIASVALRRVRRVVGYERAAVVLFDWETSRARFVSVEQLKEYGPTTGTIIPVEDFAPPQVLQKNVQAFIEDVSTLVDPSPVMQALIQSGIRSALFTPLTVEGKLIGELNLMSDRPNAFTDEHQEIAREVANQVAVTLQQARLRSDLERHAAELEERVAQRTSQLEAANKELEAFSFSVSHDLRAPLRSIISFANLLFQDYGDRLDTAAQHYLELVRDNAVELSNMVEHLLKFSRTGREALNIQRISMENLARQAHDLLISEELGRRIELQIGTLPDCYADPALLKQVWQNLLSNALKFTRSREIARIEVGFCERDGEGIYFVRDNGVGFDMQYASKLFGVFQRLHHPEDYPGTGVGLAIVQRIVNRHGGRIWAESRPDQGATFYFTLATRSTSKSFGGV